MKTKILIPLITILVINSNIKSQIHPVDSLVIYELLTSFNRSFDTSLPLLQWHPGIVINSNNRIKSLWLYHGIDSGPIPPSIGLLEELEHLHVRKNKNLGNIPIELYNLPKLEYLKFFLATNCFDTIPSEIGNLISIKEMSFSFLNMQGTIPPEIGNLSNIEILGFSSLNISGTIPLSIGNLKNLKIISISSIPNMTGSIPDTLTTLPLLRVFSFTNSSFTGELPQDIGLMPNLNHIDVQNNQLSGAIPASVTISRYNQPLDIFINDNNFDALPYMEIDSFAYGPTFWQVYNNKFTFEDFEPLALNNSLCWYFHCYYNGIHPQDSVWFPLDTTVEAGSPVMLNSIVGGTANHYQWYRDGLIIPGATNPILYTPAISLADSGVYTCRIWNTIVTPKCDLVLDRHHVKVRVIDTSTDNKVTLEEKQPDVYPNPFSESLTLNFNKPSTYDTQYSIYRSDGTLYRKILTNKYYQIINTTDLPRGLYLVKIFQDNKVYTYKVIKD